MTIDFLDVQLAAASQRLASLQRKSAVERDPTKLLERALKELEGALEEVRVAQEQHVENRQRVEELQAELTRQSERYWQLFDQMPQAYVVTRADSTITEANRAAAELFNVSQRFLIGKTLSVFVCEERARFLTESARLATEAGSQELLFKLRPRERAPLDVRARVSGDGAGLRWVLDARELKTAAAS